MNAHQENEIPDTLTPALQSITSMQQIHIGAEITIQAYVLSILNQQPMELHNFPHLKDEEDKINFALSGAKAHAKDYLDDLQPKILRSLVDMENYIALHQSSTNFLNSDMPIQDFLDILTSLKNSTSDYRNTANDVVAKLTTLRDSLTSDSSAFGKLVSDFHSKTGGDVDELKNITDQITTIQHDISLDIALAAASGLGILAGGVLIFVGAATEVFTANASTAAVIGGIGLLAAGIGGEAATGVRLWQLIQEKSELVNKQVALQDEIKATQNLVAGYTGLAQHSQDSYNAAKNMANTWNLLGDGLDSMISLITKDQNLASKEYAKKILIRIMCGAVINEIKNLGTNIKLIEEQYSGIHQKTRSIINNKERDSVFYFHESRSAATPQINVDPTKTVLELMKG